MGNNFTFTSHQVDKVETFKSFAFNTALIYIEADGYPDTKSYKMELFDCFMGTSLPFHTDYLNENETKQVINFYKRCLCHKFKCKTTNEWKVIYTNLPFEISHKKGDKRFATINGTSFSSLSSSSEKMTLRSPWGYTNLSLT